MNCSAAHPASKCYTCAWISFMQIVQCSNKSYLWNHMLYKSLSRTVCRWRCDRICITCDNLTGVIQISLLLYRQTLLLWPLQVIEKIFFKKNELNNLWAIKSWVLTCPVWLKIQNMNKLSTSDSQDNTTANWFEINMWISVFWYLNLSIFVHIVDHVNVIRYIKKNYYLNSVSLCVYILKMKDKLADVWMY